MRLSILGSDPALCHNSTDCTYNYYQAATTSGLLLFIVYPRVSIIATRTLQLYYLSVTIWTQIDSRDSIICRDSGCLSAGLAESFENFSAPKNFSAPIQSILFLEFAARYFNK